MVKANPGIIVAVLAVMVSLALFAQPIHSLYCNMSSGCSDHDVTPTLSLINLFSAPLSGMNSTIFDLFPLSLNTSDLTPNGNSASQPVMARYDLYDDFSSKSDNLWSISDWEGSLETRYMPTNVWYNNGMLVLRSLISDRTGGEVVSTGTYHFGKYRAIMKLDQTPGTYMAFFTFKGPSTSHNEIDIEISKEDGQTTAYFNSAYYMDGVTNGQYTLTFDPGQAFHTYGFDWYPDHITWYVDDVPVFTSTSNIPQDPCSVIFDTYVIGQPDEYYGDGVNTLYVDRVSVQPFDQ